MSQSAATHARIDLQTKALEKELQPELREPNKLTAAVLAKSRKSKETETFKSAEAIYMSWEES